ncbi:hypothetical protein KEJ34_03375 [Candidatus Bathyarchaeota archaeon]|nr:hypothetical protein [Candidatus Bathyarchaeota archaeon]
MFLPRFPSRLRRFVRVPADYIHENLPRFLSNVHEEESDGSKFFRANISGGIGAKLRVYVLPEGEVSSMDLRFDYRGLALILILLLVILIGLSLALSSITPLFGVLLILLLIYKVNFAVENLLNDLSNILLGFEIEYARKRLMEERARWQQNPKDVSELYRRLCEKHIKTWGNTYALEYKINEYQKEGLTKEESIRKVAEQEGIF